MQADVAIKLASTHDLCAHWRQNLLMRNPVAVIAIESAGRPEHPQLVDPRELAKRGFGTEAGRVCLVHAIAHIEFNAINLALDAVYRFQHMPQEFYGDWLKVAAEEALHFSLLNEYLEAHGSYYGAFSAHNGLWEMTQQTSHDVLVRMALVPRVLEARGLDVTPGMIRQLQKFAAHDLVDILQIIFHDEIGHVAIGSRWFNYCCAERGLSPTDTFKQLLTQHSAASIIGPFEIAAREAAGFTRIEMDILQQLDIRSRNAKA